MTADPRYLEAWKRTFSDSSAEPSSSAPVALPNGYGFSGTSFGAKLDKAAASQTLNVRLDTPGGVTYSPSDLGSHNAIKRMFIPYKVGETTTTTTTTEREEGETGKQDEGEYDGAAMLPVQKSGEGIVQPYDFGPDIQREVADPDISDARKYALSIDLNTLAGRPEGGTSWAEMKPVEKGEEMEKGKDDAQSTSGQTAKTTASTRTTATMATLATQKPDGSLPDWYLRPSSKKDVVPFVVPPSYTGKAEDLKRPWAAMRWKGHRAFERPSRRDVERGIASFQDVNGPGNAPSIAESSLNKEFDKATITSGTTLKAAGKQSLSVADLFVLDPRITRPLRMVRRSDPRQVLLLSSGVYMDAGQAASLKAAQAARDAGLSAHDLTSSSKQAQDMLVKLSKQSEPRGGIGVLYCPSDEPLSQEEEIANKLGEPRAELNTCKKLEAAPNFAANTERRAQLRAALAALELANWEEEGFDKIVIGVEKAWIVRGITVDIWRWRHTGWKLTENGEQGAPGESVPDRDLWEALDEAVRKYESIDCNVRFWHVSMRDSMLARKLAEQGAMKDVQQRPTLVRWRKKMAPPLMEEAERRKKAARKANHQGPTLLDVR